MQIIKSLGNKINTDIYTGLDQKTLRPVVNPLNKKINSITIIIRVQIDYKKVNNFITTSGNRLP